jgi:hypothetical protein
MKKIQLLFLLILILVLTSEATSQLADTRVFKRPNFVMDVVFGYALPGFDFAGSRLKDFWEFKGYGINGGYYASFTPKVTVHNYKKAQIRTYFTVAFTQFVGSENQAYGISSIYDTGMVPVGWPGGNTYQKVTEVTGSSRIRISAPFLAYGWEFSFYTDRERRSLFNFGTDFNLSVMWGKIYDQASYNNYEYHNNIVAATRMGLGLSLGYSYRVTESFGITFGTRMQMSNLFNKGSDIVKIGDDGDMYLNDGSNTSINPLLSKNRNIGFFGFYGGASFYLGGKR